MLFITKLKLLSDVIIKQKNKKILQVILKNIIKKVFSFMGGKKLRGKQGLLYVTFIYITCIYWK